MEEVQVQEPMFITEFKKDDKIDSKHPLTLEEQKCESYEMFDGTKVPDILNVKLIAEYI